jgi:hypothetical protein
MAANQQKGQYFWIRWIFECQKHMLPNSHIPEWFGKYPSNIHMWHLPRAVTQSGLYQLFRNEGSFILVRLGQQTKEKSWQISFPSGKLKQIFSYLLS